MKDLKKEKSVSSGSLEEKIKKVLVNYVSTQLVLIVFTTLVVLGVLTLLKVKYALILAILTGVSSVIPNFGIIISTIIVTLVAIFDGSTFLPNLPPVLEGIVVLVILILLNKLVDFFIAPLLLSKTSKTNPILLIFAVLIGTAFFGIAGAILSVPLVLVTKTIIEHYSKEK
jgi:predicted PurR-regulated permease PerM